MKRFIGSVWMAALGSTLLLAACSDSSKPATGAGGTTGSTAGTTGSTGGTTGSTAGTTGSTAGTTGSTGGTTGATGGTTGSTGGTTGSTDAGTDTAGGGNDAHADTSTAETAADPKATATLVATTGNNLVGTAVFTDHGGIVTMVLSVTSCPAGKHAFHLHANAVCGADGAAAGAHWVPKGENLGELTCGTNGTGTATFTTTSAGYWTIGGDAASNLLPHAVVVHTGDNTNPGDRLSCGVPVR